MLTKKTWNQIVVVSLVAVSSLAVSPYGLSASGSAKELSCLKVLSKATVSRSDQIVSGLEQIVAEFSYKQAVELLADLSLGLKGKELKDQLQKYLEPKLEKAIQQSVQGYLGAQGKAISDLSAAEARDIAENMRSTYSEYLEKDIVQVWWNRVGRAEFRIMLLGTVLDWFRKGFETIPNQAGRDFYKRVLGGSIHSAEATSSNRWTTRELLKTPDDVLLSRAEDLPLETLAANAVVKTELLRSYLFFEQKVGGSYVRQDNVGPELIIKIDEVMDLLAIAEAKIVEILLDPVNDDVFMELGFESEGQTLAVGELERLQQLESIRDYMKSMEKLKEVAQEEVEALQRSRSKPAISQQSPISIGSQLGRFRSILNKISEFLEDGIVNGR